MGKYRVYAIASASWLVGEYEAATKEEALKLADDDINAEWSASLCHQCSSVEIGDVNKAEVEEIECPTN